MHEPYATIVCWHCRRSDVTLLKVKSGDGDKITDYVCVKCAPMYPAPPIGNSSRIYHKKPAEIQAENQ